MKKSIQKLWQRRSIRISTEVIVIIIVLFALRLYTQKDLVSGQAPELHGQLINGQNFTLSDVSSRPVLVHFWATWCPVCKLEEDSIQAISEDYTVITIAMQSGSGAEVSDYMSTQGLGFSVINDPQGLLAKRFGVSAVPSSFIIDRDNRIAFRETGFTSEWGLRLRMWWSD